MYFEVSYDSPLISEDFTDYTRLLTSWDFIIYNDIDNDSAMNGFFEILQNTP